MSFIEREINRLAAALRQLQRGETYQRLYAAQQALSWAMEPNGFASPLDSIARNATEQFTDIQEGSEDCSPLPHPPASSDTCCQTD